uniref:Protein root UVB sensitive/RUS domain-containing protein n=1 Tax=Lactuca sativa TaxID=4236 RepID=A0A9R1V3B1_LACSA|nr:hypothetical protein LSAT_V11C700369300 [Lactuca sativa]
MFKTMAQTPLSEDVGASISWIETSDTISRHIFFQPDDQFSISIQHMITLIRFLQLGCLTIRDQMSTKWLNLSSTNSSPLVLKDGMQHMGKLICSNLGALMDAEPKRWRILADVLYDLGTGLEIISPLCPQLFLETAGLGIFSKLQEQQDYQIILHLQKEKPSQPCLMCSGQMVVGSLLSIIHVYSVSEEMRVAPVSTLNPQRSAMIIEDFIKIKSVRKTSNKDQKR